MTNQIFTNLSFALCGKFSHRVIKRVVKENGGTITKVDSYCDFLISTLESCNLPEYQTAINLRIPIISREYIQIMIETQEPPSYFDNNEIWILWNPNKREIPKELFKIPKGSKTQPDYHTAFEKAGLLITLTPKEEKEYMEWIEHLNHSSANEDSE